MPKEKMTQNIQKFWDKQANRYDKAERQFAAIYNGVLAKTSNYLSPHDQVLDYGCATGNKTIELAQKVGHIHGLDISAEMIYEANRKKNELHIPNITFSQGTIYNADLRPNSFDTITAFGIIHLLEDYEKAIQRIYELLKPGGLFVSTTACMNEKMAVKTKLQVMLIIFMKRLGIFPLHVNRFTSTGVVKILETQNFRILETEKITDGIPAIFIIARK